MKLSANDIDDFIHDDEFGEGYKDDYNEDVEIEEDEE